MNSDQPHDLPSQGQVILNLLFETAANVETWMDSADLTGVQLFGLGTQLAALGSRIVATSAKASANGMNALRTRNADVAALPELSDGESDPECDPIPTPYEVKQDERETASDLFAVKSGSPNCGLQHGDVATALASATTTSVLKLPERYNESENNERGRNTNIDDGIPVNASPGLRTLFGRKGLVKSTLPRYGEGMTGIEAQSERKLHEPSVGHISHHTEVFVSENPKLAPMFVIGELADENIPSVFLNPGVIIAPEASSLPAMTASPQCKEDDWMKAELPPANTATAPVQAVVQPDRSDQAKLDVFSTSSFDLQWLWQLENDVFLNDGFDILWLWSWESPYEDKKVAPTARSTAYRSKEISQDALSVSPLTKPGTPLPPPKNMSRQERRTAARTAEMKAKKGLRR